MTLEHYDSIEQKKSIQIKMNSAAAFNDFQP